MMTTPYSKLNDNEKTGLNIMLQRRSLGMSQKQLARLIGVDQATISRMEVGAVQIEVGELGKLAEALKLSREELLP